MSSVLEHLQELTKPIRAIGAPKIIRSFDVDFDLSMQQHLALHALGILGAFEEPKLNAGSAGADLAASLEDWDQWAIYCGAHWCRMVAGDVQDRYHEALQSQQESRSLARALVAWLNSSEQWQGTKTDYRFAAYVAARWCDAAAKIAYRSQDYAEARDGFSTAIALAKRTNEKTVLPDLISNLARAEFEHARVVLGSSDSRSYAATIEKTICVYRSDTDREARRGIASLYHNLASILWMDKQANHARAKEAAEEALRRAEALDDGYRVGQATLALVHARTAAIKERYKKGQHKPEAWSPQYDERTELEWCRQTLAQLLDETAGGRVHLGGRNRRMLRQNLAEIQALQGEIAPPLNTLRELLADLRHRQRQPSGSIGYDLPYHTWTVRLLSDYFKYHLDKDELNHEVRGVLEAGRRVIRVSTYRRDFAKTVAPRYAELIGEEKDPDGRLALVEEAAARELMDVIGQVQEVSVTTGGEGERRVAGAGRSPSPCAHVDREVTHDR